MYFNPEVVVPQQFPSKKYVKESAAKKITGESSTRKKAKKNKEVAEANDDTPGKKERLPKRLMLDAFSKAVGA